VEATEWLLRENPSAARRFVDEFERCIAFILRHPEASPLATPRGSRRKLMGQRFQYSIYYAIEPDRIRVLAVAHQRRRPFYWLRRELS
jgi:plasmid stabilization system protein ParE